MCQVWAEPLSCSFEADAAKRQLASIGHLTWTPKARPNSGWGTNRNCNTDQVAQKEAAQILHVLPHQETAITLLKGLIGAKCTTQVTIADKDCSVWLDSGSQVTTILNSIYLESMSYLPVHALNNLREVKGSNGQGVPYLDCVETNSRFPKSLFGADNEVTTLVLVVPDMCFTLSSADRHKHFGCSLWTQYRHLIS